MKTWHIASATRDSAKASERMVEEMRTAREEEVAPYIIAYFDVPHGSSTTYLVIKNVGKTAARDVRMQFDPPLANSDGTSLQDIPMIKHGIPSFPPAYEIRTFFDTGYSYFQHEELPMAYTASITYRGGLDDQLHQATYVLDLSVYKGLSWLQEKGIRQLVDETKRLSDSARDSKRILERISERLDLGIQAKNTGSLISYSPTTSEQWITMVTAKLGEFSSLWTAVYLEGGIKQYNPFLSDIQSMSGALGQQLLALASSRPRTVGPEISDRLSQVAVLLFQIAYKEFFMDGGKSFEMFAEIGNNAVAQSTDILRGLIEIQVRSEDEAAAPKLIEPPIPAKQEPPCT